MKKQITLLAAIFALWSTGYAQAPQEPMRLSLQESINYALQHRASLQAARNEEKIAKARVGEIRSAGLPQLNATVDAGDNFIQQQSFLPSEFFQNQDNPPPLGTFVPVTFAPAYTSNATITGSQLLFDGTYLIGLKAASTYTELSRKNTQRSEIEVAEQVSKAYYSVLVNSERMQLLTQNLVRLDTLLSQTSTMYENGVAEKLDVDRLSVQRNNLLVEQQKTQRLMAISENLLKFQMGLNQAQPVLLVDELAEVEIDMSQVYPQDFDYANRIEFSILETQRDLASFQVQADKAGYLPKLFLNARYGYNAASNEFRDITRTGNYLEYGFVGVQLQLPIFDGLRKHYLIQQSKLALENTKLGFETLRQSIDMELAQASTELTNALDVLDARKANMVLAEEIARVAKIKFQEGVGTNLEVVSAETDLREAQTNYYAAMYDALIAKVNLSRATGTLHSK
ncbi:TolC family protein [Pontibacter akesuensis]|uniref:Outer membrane protein TolC n=1 Tax=Pontibacter akesuensis TaxID=388950 RepID=A0A1I7ICP4_9BACT|nr:TolC family protein [Pontibacter akesuensis]GHA66443.1 transporter [Pontibacter akesuensis]SFU70722.1 Outer membrane protein TolC [Pontibacter akesuensis]